jgi:hypothetical protein
VEDVSTERGRLFLKITRPNHTAPTTKVWATSYDPQLPVNMVRKFGRRFG